jgi:hypothetical protein
MRRELLIGLVALVAAGGAGGCGDAKPSSTAPAPGSAAERPAGGGASAGGRTAGAADDPPGTFTCALLADAVAKGSLMDTGVVDGIVSASGSADAPVSDAAQRLASAYAAAKSSSGSESEPDAIAAVSAAAADMSGICADSGLKSVG